MEGVEVLYRAWLGRLYAQYLIHGVKEVTIIYDETPSCVAIAASVAALAEDRVLAAVKSGEIREEVDNALLIMNPQVERLGERAAAVLKKVRRFVALHTPVFYALDEVKDVSALLEGKEVRFAVRETPWEVTFYKVVASRDGLKTEPYAAKTLTPGEVELIRKFEILKA
ncbi:MAG: hypothetical protein ACK4SY_00340 [Pyrobaculum sp.]